MYNDLRTNYTVKKGNDFPVPARESLVNDIRAGDGKIVNLFYSVRQLLDGHLADMFRAAGVLVVHVVAGCAEGLSVAGRAGQQRVRGPAQVAHMAPAT